MEYKLKFKPNSLKPLKNQKSVCYLVGAGFSNATKFNLPLNHGFLSRRFSKFADGEPKDVDVKDESNLSSLLISIEKDYGQLNELNLESVMSDLYVRIYGIGRSWEFSDYPEVYQRPINNLQHDFECLIYYIRERLHSIDSPLPKCDLTHRFVSSLKRQDSIITLNYDTVIEQHLKYNNIIDNRLDFSERNLGTPELCIGRSGEPMFQKYNSCPDGIFSKLHGSIDWFSCSNNHCPNHQYIQPFGTWCENKPEGTGTLHCVHCGWTPKCVIIPPVASKSFELYPKLNMMWSNSYQALRLARRWVLFGVSLAPTDFHLSSLFQSVSRDQIGSHLLEFGGQICIVDKNPKKVANRLVDSLSPKLAIQYKSREHEIVIFESFDDYFEAIKKIDVEREDVVDLKYT